MRYKLKIKRLLGFIFFILTSLFFCAPTFAQQPNQPQFAASYKVNYDVGEDGVTLVTEKVSLKNLTDRFYPKNFSLVVPSTKIKDVQAVDSSGDMSPKVSSQDGKTQIDVDFNSQIVGQDKVSIFTLTYKSSDFAQKVGKVWQVTIPKINAVQSSDSYDGTLAIPVSFGDPTTMTPEPVSQSEINGKINFEFTKKQLLDSGIFASFGDLQQFSFVLKYNLINNSFFPSEKTITLPPNTEYQDVLINNITPKPDQVTKDQDGNLIGYFLVEGKQAKQVSASGEAKLRGRSNKSAASLSQKQLTDYTSAQKYWESSSPQIKGNLGEILQGINDKATNQDKALLINKYLTKNLIFDSSRAKSRNFDRLGALTVMNYRDQALDSEFTDYFISLSRAANIPARMLVGYAFSGNNEIRPSSYNGMFHAWPEYYDPSLGWLMADPTWQQTTGGVDYFNSFDLNHLVLVIRGVSSTLPDLPSEATVNFSDSEFMPKDNISASILVPSEVFAWFPNKLKVRFENDGNISSKGFNYQLSSSKIILNGPSTGSVPSLPPGGFYEANFSLSSKKLLDSYQDNLVLFYDGKSINQPIQIHSFFTHQYFALVISCLVGFMILGYIFVLMLHLNKGVKPKKKPKK